MTELSNPTKLFLQFDSCQKHLDNFNLLLKPKRIRHEEIHIFKNKERSRSINQFFYDPFFSSREIATQVAFICHPERHFSLKTPVLPTPATLPVARKAAQRSAVINCPSDEKKRSPAVGVLAGAGRNKTQKRETITFDK